MSQKVACHIFILHEGRIDPYAVEREVTGDLYSKGC